LIECELTPNIHQKGKPNGEKAIKQPIELLCGTNIRQMPSTALLAQRTH